MSIIIPVYNIEQHLRQCLDSVVSQTLDDLEIICVDDGSTDTSLQILEEYAAEDDRLQVISQKNSGPGAARNAGFERATGEFVIFLDSDDWFEPDFLELMTQKAEQTEADITICRAVEFDTQTGREFPSEWMLKSRYVPGESFAPGDIAKHIFQFTYGWPWDKLYRTLFLRKERFQYPNLPNSEDVVYVFASLAAAKTLAVTDRTLVHHRVNRRSSVSNSLHRNPNAPCRAVRLLEKELLERGLYSSFKQSFLNWSMDFLVWGISDIGDKAVQKNCFQAFRCTDLSSFHFLEYPVSYYENKFTYAKFLLVRFAPWPVFSFILRGYHGLKRFREGRFGGRTKTHQSD